MQLRLPFPHLDVSPSSCQLASQHLLGISSVPSPVLGAGDTDTSKSLTLGTSQSDREQGRYPPLQNCNTGKPHNHYAEGKKDNKG